MANKTADEYDAEIDAFLDANPVLEAVMNLPGAYLSSHTIESIPGVMEVTPLQYSFESPVEHWGSSQPNVQNVEGGTPKDQTLIVMDVCGTDVRVLQEETIPLCSRCGKPALSRVESPDGKIGCLDCFQSFLSADGKHRLLRGWHKDRENPSELAVHARNTWQEMLDSFLLYVAAPGTNLEEEGCRKRVEEIAGPCDFVYLGNSVHITRLTPSPDGTHLEITIDY